MLTTSGIKSVEYYLRLAREDYYTKGGEPKGRWLGGSAEYFGLEGKLVTNRPLRQSLDGFSPIDPDEKLVTNAGVRDGERKRQLGWDLTFSAPKEVSLLFAASSPETRKAIQRAQLNAATRALTYLEENAVFSRRGSDGKTIDHGKFLVAAFEHCTSRNGEPNLHTHCLVPNWCLRPDLTTGSLYSNVEWRRNENGKPIKFDADGNKVPPKSTWNTLLRHNKAAGAIYRTELASQLEKGPGFEVDREHKRIGFRLKGVPEEAVKANSTRTAEVEAEIHRYGFYSPKAAKVATLVTRDGKPHVDRAKLFPKWQSELASYGLTEKHIDENLRDQAKAQQTAHLVLDKAVDRAKKELTEERSSFSERELTEFVARHAEHHAVSADHVLARVAYEIACGDLIYLREEHSERIFTTPEVKTLEHDFLQAIAEAKTKTTHQVPAHILSDAIHKENEEQGFSLTPEQTQALSYLVTGKNETDRPVGRLRVLVGDAGSGKTSVIRTARRAFEAAGYTCRGASLSGVATEKLEAESGIQSSTLAKWVHEDEKNSVTSQVKHHTRMLYRTWRQKHTWSYDDDHRLDEKTVLIIDEAGLSDSPLLLKTQLMASAAGALVCYVGDPKQLQPVGHGGSLTQAARISGFARLEENFRQFHPEDKAVAKLCAQAKGGEALRNLAERGRVTVSPTEDQAIERLVSDWATQGGVFKPDEHMVFVTTNKQRMKANAACQAARIEGTLQHRLRASEKNFEGQRIYAGDRITFRENVSFFSKDRSLAGFIKNEAKKALHQIVKQDWTPKRERIRRGTFGTVLSISPRKSMKVALDDGRILDVPLFYIPKPEKWFPKPSFLRKERVPIGLGYASTTHLSQSRTIDGHTYSLLGGSLVDNQLSYVQLSRAKHGMRVYTGIQEAGGELTLLSMYHDANRRGYDKEITEIRKRIKNLPKEERLENSDLARRMSMERQKQFATAPAEQGHAREV